MNREAALAKMDATIEHMFQEPWQDYFSAESRKMIPFHSIIRFDGSYYELTDSERTQMHELVRPAFKEKIPFRKACDDAMEKLGLNKIMNGEA